MPGNDGMDDMKTLTTATLLAAMLINCACDGSAKTTAFIQPNDTQQISSLNWEAATAATSAARVSNNSLIMMR